MKVVFVILHYMSFDDTFDCIQSLLSNINYYNFEIVVVDNGSNNSSYEKLLVNFSNNEKVHLIQNEKNLGFAKGNNKGFKYAKEKLKSDFIILLNNDTLIRQSEFINELIEVYKENEFNILGPDIVSTIDGQHQNPQRTNSFSVNDIKVIIKKLTIKLWLNRLKLEWLFNIIKIIGKKNVEKQSIGYDSNLNWEKDMKNVQLHGACLIFDPQYVKRYNGLYSNTFMYAEEDILSYIAKKEKLLVMYTPRIKVYHKEASATNQVFTKNESKRRFIYHNSKKSLNEIIKFEKNEKIYKNDIIDKSFLCK